MESDGNFSVMILSLQELTVRHRMHQFIIRFHFVNKRLQPVVLFDTYKSVRISALSMSQIYISCRYLCQYYITSFTQKKAKNLSLYFITLRIIFCGRLTKAVFWLVLLLVFHKLITGSTQITSKQPRSRSITVNV